MRFVVSLALLASMGVAAAQTPLPPVSVATVERMPVIEEVALVGTVTSPRVAQLSPAVAGLVSQVKVEVGDRVEAGETLLILDRELDALALQSREAATKQARAELADARRRLAEAKSLMATNGIAETEMHARQAQVEMAAAALERSQAEQQRQAARLERHTVKAPFAGVISRKLTESGEWVQSGTSALELVANDRLRIDFQAPQGYYPRIDKKTAVTVALSALPERRFDARISAIVPVSDPSARTFTLHVRLANPQVPMTPGMSARATLQLEQSRRGIVVPRDAILRHPDGRVTVWVVDGSAGTAKVAERQVALGHSFAGKVAIREGLKAGERIVVGGNEALQPGQRVSITDTITNSRAIGH